MKRRHFFRTSALAGGGLLMSTFIPISCNIETITQESWEPNFFLRIDPDNTITFICSITELGQGTSTGLTMIVADELGIAIEKLKVEFGDGAFERYGNFQDTGGSNGLRLLWNPLRKAMATTREIFILAAAQKWGVEPNDCYSENGWVNCKSKEKKTSYTSLIELAKKIPIPLKVKLKDASAYKYIGKPVIGKRAKTIVEGQLPYSINFKIPNMVYAAIARCPVWNGKLIRFDATKAKEFPGVINVIEVSSTKINPTNDFKGGVRSGVAVLANNTWAALEAKKLLEIEWDLGRFAKKSDSDVKEELIKQLKEPKRINANFKEAAKILKNSNKKFKATYISPYQANACMEPLNATAHHKGNTIEIWAGSQAPAMFRERIYELTGIPEAAIVSHNLPSGGGFGRRFHSDYVEEAVLISEKIRKPVKVTWSREDTFRTSKYHPLCVDSWDAVLDKNNKAVALGYQGTLGGTNGFRPYPYPLPKVHYNSIYEKKGWLLPRASWRSVYAHPWAFSLECFIDELADLAQIDPIEYRLHLLEKAEVVEQIMDIWVGDNLYPKKLRRTLEKVKLESNWGQTKENHYQGVSSISYNTSYCSQVIEISIDGKELYVERVTVVMDCGKVINPSLVKAQVEGSVIWGLTAALKDKITVKNGSVEQENYHSYDVLRIDEAPIIDVHLLDSQDSPSGAGEPAVPGVAPALLNAVFAATGNRIREIPISTKL
ncbi:isoquinoline 1-oxidoreductase beta subunit [Aquimarina sp. MAR_2010_214]|uniref:xanthine dehydrogenase family protein molybdopterin-binding subunit n=1 Tax=Aquimarina sp. MAR_2010_214 TaxID=1250026 RepID=UPI000C6FD5F5|nr:molybdopterin cofactor-binding domain-containing protein [Aquimarina sp. MAR_2010_214]PKV49088.1 isoquinoline 1-oxidoreductase beta subunit [Aquimarina sp. MAR_2010_214]